MKSTKFSTKAAILAVATALSGTVGPAFAQDAQKPNIVFIMGDDIGCGTSAPTTAA